MGDANAYDSPDPGLSGFTGDPGAQSIQESVQRGPPQVTDDAGYEALAPGAEFLDPQGNTRKKPYTIRAGRHADTDFEAVPEGEQFVDPEGNVRQKPAYQPLSYSAQALHSMAINPKEQRKALEYAYPDAEITDTPDGPVVNDNGVMRKAGATRGIAPMLGAATAGIAPTAGAILGALGGGAGGSAVPVIGTFAGGAAGAFTGGATGQAVNDAIFSAIAGSDRTAGEEAGNLALAGLSSTLGMGVGRGAAMLVPSAKAGVSAARAALPGLARYATGASKDVLETAERLGNRGYAVPPSGYAPKMAHLQNMAEVLDPAFRTDKPLMQQNYAAYEQDAAKMLQGAGVPEFEDLVKAPSLTDPTAAIPVGRVGEALKERAMQQAGEADANLQQAFEQRRQAMAQGLPDTQSQQAAILRAQEESRRAVDNLLNQNYARINQDVDRAYALSRTGANTGEAWQQVAQQFRDTRQAIGERATRMYNDSHALGGDTPISSESLTQAARDVAQSLPEEFRTTQPAVVRRLEAMAGQEEVRDPATGAVTREAVPPTNPTFAELHELRSIMRTNADFSRLNSDVRNGTYKHFNNVIDQVIHDANAQPHLQAAAQALDQADAFYRENIPIFNASELKAVMRGVEAGEPANPIGLFKAIVKADQPQMTARIREMVGPNLWSAVQAAHVQDLMRRSASKEVPGQIDARAFAKNVLEDHNNGLLQQVQNPEMVNQLMQQVNLLAAADGKIPIPANSGDRMLDVIARARAADREAKNLAKSDPLVALKKEGDRINKEQARALNQAARARGSEPLGFLFDAKVGTHEAANRILGNPDLMLAAADKFGRGSPEFKMLQQAYLWKVLRGDMNPGEAMANIAPEIQHLIFPGTTLPQLQELAKDMAFLTKTRLMGGQGGDTGGSMMARAKVSKPPEPSSVRKFVAAFPLAGPVVDYAARSILAAYYEMVAKLSTKPALFSFMLKGLRGTAEQRLEIRHALDEILQRGSVAGAALGEGAYQNRDVQ